MNPITIANQAYDKDFRWWFLALLAFIILAGIWVVRYLVVRAEKSDLAHNAHVTQLMTELTNSRQNHHDRMENVTAQMFKQSADLAGIIAANTAESKEVRRLLEHFQMNGISK